MSALEEKVAQTGEEPIKRKLRLTTCQGLHARPAAFIVKLLRTSRSKVTFTYKQQTVDAHSVLHLLMLGAPKNATITAAACGPDAEETLEKLEAAFEQKFGDLEL
jgi:phosphocarrier protein HPr